MYDRRIPGYDGAVSYKTSSYTSSKCGVIVLQYDLNIKPSSLVDFI